MSWQQHDVLSLLPATTSAANGPQPYTLEELQDKPLTRQLGCQSATGDHQQAGDELLAKSAGLTGDAKCHG
jgi:hypothetical protein